MRHGQQSPWPTHESVLRSPWIHALLALFIQLLAALVILSGMADRADAQQVRPFRPEISAMPSRPLLFPDGVEKAEQLLQDRPALRLEAVKQMAGQVLNVDPADVGIGGRKILNLGAYDLGDGKTAWVNLWQASLSYGLGVQPGNERWMWANPAALSPFSIDLMFVPGIEKPRLYVVSLDGWFHASSSVKYDAFSSGPRRDICKSCLVNLSPGSGTVHILVEPSYPAKEIGVDITVQGAAIVSSIDITAIK
jgi:hypothetical protein